MSFEFFDHTADVGARILTSSVDELFVEAAIALTTTITDPTLVGVHTSWEVALQDPDLEQLLVAWMSELIGRFDIDQLFACAAAVRVSRAGEGWSLTAIVQGEKISVPAVMAPAGG
jgi:SHS2 domain-containing protein